MDQVEDLDTIDVELDEYFKKKEVSRCKDEFLNTLCEEDENAIIIETQETDIESAQHKDTEDEDFQVACESAIHNPNAKWNTMKPVEGERYENPHQLKLCVTNYSISKGYQVRFKKCDSVRLVVVCARDPEKCPFILRAFWMSTERSFQIKKLVDKHTCVRNFNNPKLMEPTWLARHFVKELIRKPTLKCREMKAIVQSRFHTVVGWFKCYRARMRALSLIHGKLSDHYAKIWEYGHELGRSNPGSSIMISVTENPNKTTTFLRIYICFKAIKEGWKRGCRRVIGLDGCFLKGQVKGELLTAIGRDANNHVYPIAWAVVEVENKINWVWFLKLVAKDLGLDDGIGMCLISDQHKGLQEAVKLILPKSEHRQCARHIYANFRKVWSGLEFRTMFWAAAKSTTEGEFKFHMERIKTLSNAAYEHLMTRQPSSWCMAFFRGGLACEAVENGVVECFNAIIIEARKKPLITMLEEIRLYIMERHYFLKNEAEKWEGEVCPASVKKMEKFSLDLKNWIIVPSGVTSFEVRNGFDSFGVDLQEKSCTCRLWDISGIPCVHAQVALHYTNQDPAKSISEWFSKANYKATYSSNILPVNGSKMWKEVSKPKPLPPVARRMPGRPSYKRKRHVSENQDKYPHTSSKGRTVQCKNCLQKGHNKKTCKNPTVYHEPQPKKKMGRPKLDNDLLNWTGIRRGARGGKRGGGRGGRRGGGRGGGRGVAFGEGTSQAINTEDATFEADQDAFDEMMASDEMWENEAANVGRWENEAVNDEKMDNEDYEDEGTLEDEQDQLKEIIKALANSKYTQEEILDILGLTENEFAELGGIEILKDVPIHNEDACAVKGIIVETMIEEEVEDAVKVSLEVIVEGLVDVPVEVAVKGPVEGPMERPVLVRTRKPSERINLLKLQKPWEDKFGRGLTPEKPFPLE